MSDEKIQIPIRSDILNLIVSFCFSTNKNIMFKDFVSIKKLFNEIDLEFVQGSINNVPVFYHISLIEFFLSERVDKKVSKIAFIKGKVLDESANKEIFTSILNSVEEISNEDIILVRNFIMERIRFLYLYKELPMLEELLLDVRTNNYNSLEEVALKYENTIKTHFSLINKTKSSQDDLMNDMVLDDDGIETLSEDLHNTLNQEGHTLSTGISELDNMFGGGVTRGEFYLLGGASGNFKSGMLLNLAIKLKLSNPKIVTNDPTKKPLIIYDSFENVQRMTFQRSVKYFLNMNKLQLKDTDPQDIRERMTQKLEETGDINCAIRFCYSKSHSKTVTDLYATIEEAESDGYEVIAIVADYLKLFKAESRSKGKELRMIMADTSRELADLGLTKDIAMISAFQLNRSAITADSINATHIQEAFAIIDHCDYSCYIRRVFDARLDNSFMQLFDGKARSSEEMFNPNQDKIFLPFEKGNSFKLISTKFENNPYKHETITYKLPTNPGQNNTQQGNAPQSSPFSKPQVDMEKTPLGARTSMFSPT